MEQATGLRTFTAAVTAGTAGESERHTPTVTVIDLDRTGSPWRFDDPGQRYPHVYGPIDPACVIEVRRLLRAADGAFLGIGPR